MELHLLFFGFIEGFSASVDYKNDRILMLCVQDLQFVSKLNTFIVGTANCSFFDYTKTCVNVGQWLGIWLAFTFTFCVKLSPLSLWTFQI